MKKLKGMLLKKYAATEGTEVELRNKVSSYVQDYMKIELDKELLSIFSSMDAHGFRLYLTVKGFEVEGKMFGERVVTYNFKLKVKDGYLVDIIVSKPSYTFEANKEIITISELKEAISSYRSTKEKEFRSAYSNIKKNPDILLSLIKLQEISGASLTTLWRTINSNN